MLLFQHIFSCQNAVHIVQFLFGPFGLIFIPCHPFSQKELGKVFFNGGVEPNWRWT